MGNTREPFLPNNTYHIYNHAIGDSNLFFEKENYYYFLQLFKKYITPFTRLYAYCLLPNHFHFVVKIGSSELIQEFCKTSGFTFSAKRFECTNNQISQLFSNFFNAYTKAVNKKYHRMGSLFINSVKRKIVLDEDYLKQLIVYVNLNAIHHDIATEFEEWEYSSLTSTIYRNAYLLDYNKTLSFFASNEEFYRLHQENFDKIKKAELVGLFKSDAI